MARILFVCLGNICRSPTAEAVFRARAATAGLSGLVIDSAGTGDWNPGQGPDRRAIAAAARRGYDLSGIRARQVTAADVTAFNYLLAMDRHNLKTLRHLARGVSGAGRIRLFREFAGRAPHEIPDPFFGADDGFDAMLDLIETASDGLIAALATQE